MISSNELAFFGDYKLLKEGEKLEEFLKKHGVKPLGLSKTNVQDLGGLIPLYSV